MGLIVLSTVGGIIYYVTLPVGLRLTRIQPQLAELSFTEQGMVVAENTTLVFPIVQGEIKELYIEEYQHVRAGDLLVSINDTPLRLGIEQSRNSINSFQSLIDNLGTEQNRSRQEMRANRDALLGELQAINAQAKNAEFSLTNQSEAIDEQIRIQKMLIHQYQADAKRAREDHSKYSVLYQAGVLPRNDFEASETALLHIETLLEASQRELEVIATGLGPSQDDYFKGMRVALNARINALNHQLGQDFTISMAQHYQSLIAVQETEIAQLEWELSNTVVTAPVDGIITTLHAKGTNSLSPTVPIAEITMPGQLDIEVHVSTQDITNIHIGDRVRLTFIQRVNDIAFYGTVSEIGDWAVVHRNHLGVEERGVKVTITPDEPPIPLGFGYEMDVTFFVYREENRFTVPHTALFLENGEYRVWVIRGGSNGVVTSIPVEIGHELRTETVITSGLFEGDYVVNDASSQALREGRRVRSE